MKSLLSNPYGGGSAMRPFIFAIITIVFFLAVIFGVQNTQRVTLAYLYWKTLDFPMYYLIFIPFIIGIVVGGLYGIKRRLHLISTIKTLQKSKAELEEKLKQVKEAQIAQEVEAQEVEAQMLEERSTETEVIPTT
jgi:uncharacterized integral membrane protein